MFSPRLTVAPGTGLLLRRPNCILFVPDADGVEPLTAEALNAPPNTIADVVVEFVLAQPDGAPSFVFIEWPTDESGVLHLLVRGGAAMSSDLPSCPELSGAGSATWVEHRTPRLPASACLSSGEAAIASTDLELGLIPAGGFELQLTATSSSPERLGPPQAETVAAPSEPTAAQGISRSAGIDALLSATDGDWMDDSLQLDQGAPRVPDTADTPRPPPTAAEPDAEPAAALIDHGDELARTRPPGPPAFPGESGRAAAADAHDDAEITLPGNLQKHDAVAPPTPPVVRARLCPNEHANPPEATHCRQCSAQIDLDRNTVTVDQPALARIKLPDGSHHGLSHTVVLGRRPNPADARLDGTTQNHVELIVVDAPASVSRTHVKLLVNGWRLFAVDCGSSGGTALVPAAESDLVTLDPWIAREINEGDRLYLGGPTTIEIQAAVDDGALQ